MRSDKYAEERLHVVGWTLLLHSCRCIIVAYRYLALCF